MLGTVEESFSEALEGLPRYPPLHPPCAEFEVGVLPGCPALEDTTTRSASGDSNNRVRAMRDTGQAGTRARIRGRAGVFVVQRTSFCRERTVIDSIERAQLRRVPNFQAGDRVRVHFLVIEGTRPADPGVRRRCDQAPGKRRARNRYGAASRSFAVGVERARSLSTSPRLSASRSPRAAAMRRTKLYYLRDRVGQGGARA